MSQPDGYWSRFYSNSLTEKEFVNSCKILFAAIVVVAVIGSIVGVVRNDARKKKSNKQDHSDRDSSDNGGVEMGSEFALGSAYFRDANETLRVVNSGAWMGGAATRRAALDASFWGLLSRAGEASDEVQVTVQAQGEQVQSARSTVENVLNELEAALPVAESLYFSGPAGPAMSYSFQLAVSNSAIDTSVEAASKTHGNAQENAVRLTTLAQEYEAVLSGLPAMAS